MSADDLCTGLAGCPQHPDGLGLDGNTRSVDGVCVHCRLLWLACECPYIVIDTDEAPGPMTMTGHEYRAMALDLFPSAVAAAKAAGWREAIEALRDELGYNAWAICRKHVDAWQPTAVSDTHREIMAAFLESLAPKETP